MQDMFCLLVGQAIYKYIVHVRFQFIFSVCSHFLKNKKSSLAILFYNCGIFCFCQICTLSMPFFQKSKVLWVSINVRAQDEYIEFLHWKWLSLRDMTQVPTASSVNGDKLKEDNFHSRLDSLTCNRFFRLFLSSSLPKLSTI